MRVGVKGFMDARRGSKKRVGGRRALEEHGMVLKTKSMQDENTTSKNKMNPTLISSMFTSFSAKSVSASFSRCITEKLRLKSSCKTYTCIRTKRNDGHLKICGELGVAKY